MSYKMKFISRKGPFGDELFIFPTMIQHDTFADMIGAKRADLLGAGFVNFDTLTCFGKSVSLNLASRPEDTALLEKHAFPE